MALCLSNKTLWLCLAASLLTAANCWPAPPFAAQVLTNASQLRVLDPAAAAQPFPVRLRAVVTFVFDRHACFVQDPTAGIFVGNGAEFPTNLAPGDIVEVQGVSNPGEYAPTVSPTVVQIITHGDFPNPRRVTYDDLVTGCEDSQWIELSGLVRDVFPDSSGSQTLEIASGGGRLAVLIPGVALTNLQNLVDSQVTVKGVCGSWFNRRRQLFGFRLLSPGLSQIVIQEPAPANTVTEPSQSIAKLLLYAPQASQGRRVKVTGTVVLQQPGRAIFVEDKQHGLYVQSRQSGILQPGDIIQLVGYPVSGEYTPTLQDAVWEKLGHGPPPSPVSVIPDEALGGVQDSCLVQIEGYLLNCSHNDRETVLLVEKDKHIFSARLESPHPAAELTGLQNQSLLQLTGVCRIEVGEDWRSGPDWRAKSFQILLRSPTDVQVLKLPPWWNLTRLLWTIGILTVVVLVSLTWAAMLRNRVNQQTAIIRRQLELEATLKERYQDLFENANDMVYTNDLTGRLTSINRAGIEMLGRPREQIVGRPLLDFITREQATAAAQWLEHIRDGKAPETLEWDFITAAGDRVRVEICTRLIEREGRQVEVEGIARDVTERRRLEKEILEISTREQRRIGHDLHDGVCQQLAGIGFLSEILADKLQEQQRPEAADAHYIGELVNKANKQTRGVARGLFPVRLEENGLVSALEELSKNAGGFLSTRCEFNCQGPLKINDQAVAHHIYYIAQEAILNAVRHGKARLIEVNLAAPSPSVCILRIRDHGSGFSSDSVGRGMGIRIMKYRARMIGGELRVQAASTGGVEVICSFNSGNKDHQKLPASSQEVAG